MLLAALTRREGKSGPVKGQLTSQRPHRDQGASLVLSLPRVSVPCGPPQSLEGGRLYSTPRGQLPSLQIDGLTYHLKNGGGTEHFDATSPKTP